MTLRIQVMREKYVDQLYADASKHLELYRTAKTFPLDDKQLLPSAIPQKKAPPLLAAAGATNRERAGSDAENAITLFSWLGDLDEAEARDRRLWAWLAHGLFAEYTQQRWPIPPEADKAVNSVHDHWFVKGAGQASLRRHSIARLWWAAHLTHAPWATFPDLIQLKQDDPFVYTRVLLGNQDVYLGTLERAFGNDRRVLIAVLEVLRSQGESGHSPLIKSMSKDVNLASRFRQLGFLHADELIALFKSYVPTAE